MHRQFIFSLIAFFFLSFPVFAYESFSEGDYYLYEGDYNSDGSNDLILYPHNFALISGSINIPLFFDTGAEPIVLQKKSAQSSSSSYDLIYPADLNVIKELFNRGLLAQSQYQLIFGDLGNTGYLDIILQPSSDDGSLIIISNEAASLKTYTFDLIDLGYNLIGSNSVTLTVSNGKLISTSNLYGNTEFSFNFSDSQTPTVAFAYPQSNASQNGTLIGQIPNSSWVDVAGSARYQVPIRLPSGINGLQPNLSLNYNSSRGNGALGVGWSLSGLPMVRRCAANLAEDGFTGGINLDQKDRFCLNGQKLVPVSGEYGAVGTVYKTEMDSFQEIRSVSGGNANPSYWQVTDKQGSVWYYGKNTDAQLTSGSNIVSWSLTQVIDLSGNEVNYSYDKIDDIGTVRAKSITYAGTKINFTYIGRADVKTSYFAGKKIVQDKLLSTINITNSVNSSMSYTYHLNYAVSEGTSRSKISEISFCGNKCVLPLTFNYQDEPLSSLNNLSSRIGAVGSYDNGEFLSLDANGDGFQDIAKIKREGTGDLITVYINQKNGSFAPWPTVKTVATSSSGASMVSGMNSPEDRGPREYLAFDINADGLDDIADVIYGNGISRFTAYMSNGVNAIAPSSPDEFGGGVNKEGNGKYYKLADINADGLTDLVTLVNRSGQSYIRGCINNGNGTLGFCSETHLASWPTLGDSENSRFILIDTNGDGLQDVVDIFNSNSSAYMHIFINKGDGYFEKVLNTKYIGEWLSSVGEKPKFIKIDTNGDGLTDLVKVRENGGRTLADTWLNTGSNDFLQGKASMLIAHDWNATGNFYPIDLNRDGVQDLLHTYQHGTSTSSVVWTSDKNGGLVKGAYKVLGSGSLKKFLVMDSNGDGFDDLTEIAYIGPTTTSTTAESGSSGFSGEYANSQDIPVDTVAVGGFSGDYAVITNPVTSNVRSWITSGSFYQDKLLQVDNGLATGNKFTYGITTDLTVYQSVNRPSGGAVRTASRAKTLVRTMSTNNGLGSFNDEYYRYHDKETHYQGLGFLGFARIEKFDTGRKIVEVSHFNQDWVTRRYASLKQKEICVLSDSFDVNSYVNVSPNYCQSATPNLLERESHNWVSDVINKDGTKTNASPISGQISYHVYKDQSLYEKWGASGDSISNRLVKRAYDTNGNLTTQTTEYGTGSSGTADSGFTLTGVQAIEKASYTYGDSNLTNKHIFKPTSLLNEAWGPTIRASVNTTNFQYDSTGLLTTKISEPGKDEQITEAYSNFDRGLPKTITRSWSSANAANTSLVGNSATEDYTYDVNGAVSSKVDALGHTQLFAAHPLYDVQSSYTDINGQTTTTEVDVLGRVTKVTAPQYTTNYEYKDCNGCANNARYYVYKTTTAQPDEKVYYDTLGRNVVSNKQILNGAWSQVTTEYNTKGQVTKVSEPSLGTPTHFTAYEYDNAGRITLENKPAGDHSIAYSYNGLLHTKAETFSGGTQTSYNSMNAFGLLDYGLDAMGNKTQYFYNGRKQLVKTIDVDLNEITIEYDVFGNRTKLVDPDKGIWTFTNNALGLVASENNGNGDDTVFSYDLLGRMTSRTNSEGISTWQYDVATNGVGQLYQAKQNGYKETYAYDGFGNLAKKVVDYGDNSETVEMNWHYVQGKLNTQTFPGGYAIKQVYNSTGYLSQIQNATDSNDVHWQANSMDARGNLTGYKLDGTLTTTRSYDAATGFVQTIESGWNGESDAQLSSYTFDSLGNLKTRDNKLFMDSITTQANQRTGQSFTYDALNRLATWNTRQFEDNQDAIQTLSMSYAANGNILSKPGVGNYNYGANQGANNCTVTPGPHAVSYIEGKGNYCYDQSGNMLSGDGKTLTYTSFDKPKTINKNGSTTEILYGPSLGRYKRIDTVAGETQTTWYLDGLYEKVLDKNSKTTERFYLGDFGLMERTTASNGIVMDQTRYFLKDHIGSVLAIAEGNSMRLLQEFHYDVWGKREYTKVYADPSLPAWDSFGLTGRQGFTGHEMLDNVGLIHMNGRVYDPELGRFVSADPKIPDPYNSQAFNRYAYVYNNPLSFTDPDGFEPRGGVDSEGNRTDGYDDDHYKKEREKNDPTPTSNDDGNVENNQNDLANSELTPEVKPEEKAWYNPSSWFGGLTKEEKAMISAGIGGAVSGLVGGAVQGAALGATLGPGAIAGAVIGGLTGAITGGVTAALTAGAVSNLGTGYGAAGGVVSEAISSGGLNVKSTISSSLSGALGEAAGSLNSDVAKTSVAVAAGAVGGALGGRMGVASGMLGAAVSRAVENSLADK